jgi:hypothetical protein
MYDEQGWIQDFKLVEAHLKKIAPSGGRRENFGGISCEKWQFYTKKSYFFLILGGGARRVRAPLDPPLTRVVKIENYHKSPSDFS